MRVLIFGDSIAQGFWDSEGGWVNRLRKVYDLQKIEGEDDDPPTIISLGVSGDSSGDILARFDNEAKARANDELAFVFAVGVNDARIDAGVNFSDVARYRKNLSKIVDQAQQYTGRIMFVGLTPCVEARSNPVSWGSICYTNGRIKEFDSILKDFCTGHNITYVDVLAPFSELESKVELLPDGLHPNARGHQLIADIVFPKLEKILRI